MTDKTDSWSLGLVILELLTKCKFYSVVESMTKSNTPYILAQSASEIDGAEWWNEMLKDSINQLITRCLVVDRSENGV